MKLIWQAQISLTWCDSHVHSRKKKQIKLNSQKLLDETFFFRSLMGWSLVSLNDNNTLNGTDFVLTFWVKHWEYILSIIQVLIEWSDIISYSSRLYSQWSNRYYMSIQMTEYARTYNCLNVYEKNIVICIDSNGDKNYDQKKNEL